MATVSATFALSTGHDDPDGYWALNESDFNNTQGLLVWGDYPGVGGYGSFLVFGVNIPAKSTIVSAHLNVRAEAAGAGANCNIKIYLENVAAGNDPSSAAAANAMALTTGTAWNSIPAFVLDSWYESVDFASELQAVINRSDYVTGNDVNVVTRNNASTAGSHRRPHGGYGAESAELHVVYEPAIAVPLKNLNFTAQTPTHQHTVDVPLVTGSFTTHLPSRNYYNVDTAGLAVYPMNPVIGSGLIDVLRRFQTNYIGERISLKFQNDGAVNLILNDSGVAVTELYRRDGTPMNIKGNHLSFKFQNNTASKAFELQYMKPFIETYENQ